MYGVAISIKGLGFHRHVGERDGLLDPVVGLRVRSHVETRRIPFRKGKPRTSTGLRYVTVTFMGPACITKMDRVGVI